MTPAIDLGPIGVGTWSWGDTQGWGYGRDYDASTLLEAFDACVERGIRLFDTAEIYGGGESERLLGSFVRRRAAPVVIATKFAPFRHRLLARTLRRALRGSLKRLRVDRVPLYQLHWPSRWVSVERWVGALSEVAREGLIGAIGVSNYSREQMLRAADALSKHGLQLASNQVEYGLLHRRPESDGVAELCREIGATLVAYSPLGMGLLSGKYSAERLPKGGQRERFTRHYVASLDPLIAKLRTIGEEHGGKTPSQVALAWVMAQGALPIPGVKNRTQALEAAGACGWRLTPSNLEALDRASRPLQR